MSLVCDFYFVVWYPVQLCDGDVFRLRARCLMSGNVCCCSVTMATEGEPSDLAKVLHLLVLSFSWGMQIWVSFIAGMRRVGHMLSYHGYHLDASVRSGFALVQQVSRHTFGLVQSKLFPVYFYCLVGSSTVSLAVYAVFHPRELLDTHESIQVRPHDKVPGSVSVRLMSWRSAVRLLSYRCCCISWR